ncbi:exodeoxyribonuclease VII small subunit [Vreelandella aquamarina]
MSDHNASSPQDFAATVEQLESLVERLESGALSLEDSLTAFEQGIRLTREAQQRLDTAELKVRALSEDTQGRPAVTPFDPPAGSVENAPAEQVPAESAPESDTPHKDTPPW